MRRCFVLALLTWVSACGGGAAETAQTTANATQNESDPAFTDYAASHGIQTLNGGGGDAPEVTADGLRLEALDKDKPVKLDGVLNEWPALAKANVVVKGSRQVGADDRASSTTRPSSTSAPTSRTLRSRPAATTSRSCSPCPSRAAPTPPTTSGSTPASPARPRGASATGGRGEVPARRSSRPPRRGATPSRRPSRWRVPPRAAGDPRGRPRRRALRRRRRRDRHRPWRPAAPRGHALGPQRAGALDDRAVSRPEGAHEGRAFVRRGRRPHGRRDARARRRLRPLPHHLRQLVPGRHGLLLPRPRRRAREARRSRRHRPREGRRRRPASRERGRTARASTSRC